MIKYSLKKSEEAARAAYSIQDQLSAISGQLSVFSMVSMRTWKSRVDRMVLSKIVRQLNEIEEKSQEIKKKISNSR